MVLKRFVPFLMIILVLQSCASQINKQGAGTAIGSITGALLGSQFGKGKGKIVSTAVGALAGSVVGGQIGQTMDEYDEALLKKSSRQALEFSPSGSTVEWNNPDSGNHGSITPTRTFKTDGRYCREYTQEVIIGGEKKNAYGRACRKPDGTWMVVK